MNALVLKLNEAKARYLLIGGQAMRLEGMPRFTMDWDFLIPARDPGNFGILNQVLAEWLDSPLVPLGPGGEHFVQTYQTPWGVAQFHLAVPGASDYDAVEQRAVWRELEPGVKVRCVGTEDLLALKKAVARPQDVLDIQFLEAKLSNPE